MFSCRRRRLRPYGRCQGDVGEIAREGVSRQRPQRRLPAVVACDGEVAWVSGSPNSVELSNCCRRRCSGRAVRVMSWRLSVSYGVVSGMRRMRSRTWVANSGSQALAIIVKARTSRLALVDVAPPD